jgi:hypothetical protein
MYFGFNNVDIHRLEKLKWIEWVLGKSCFAVKII